MRGKSKKYKLPLDTIVTVVSRGYGKVLVRDMEYSKALGLLGNLGGWLHTFYQVGYCSVLPVGIPKPPIK